MPRCDFAISVPLVKKNASTPVSRKELAEPIPSKYLISSEAGSWIAKLKD